MGVYLSYETKCYSWGLILSLIHASKSYTSTCENHLRKEMKPKENINKLSSWDHKHENNLSLKDTGNLS